MTASTLTSPAAFAVAEGMRLAGHGYYLTPVTITRKPDGKKAARFHRASWAHEDDVSNDPDQIRAWSVDYPDTSYALVCGPSGVEGVDLDVKPDEGIDRVLWWSEQGHPAGALIVETPSGGQHHIWRRHPDGRGLPNRAGQLVRGIDTRSAGGPSSAGGVFFAAGGYVLGDAGHYRILGPLPRVDELAYTPADVLDLFPDDQPKARPADGSATTHDAGWMLRKAIEQLQRVAGHQPPAGGFRHLLMGAAMIHGRLVDVGLLTRDQAVTALRQATTTVWGSADSEDEQWIQDGLQDGPRLERWTRVEPLPPTDPGDLIDRGAPTSSTSTDTTTGGLWLPNLPHEFWDAVPVLGHIRKGAHARLAPADLVLHALLARLSAMTSHLLTFDSGRGPASLNYFAAPIGPSGAGKSTGARAARELLAVPAPLQRPLDGQPVPFHDGIPLGSGEGLAESYMGQKTIEVETADGSDTYTKKVRGQVRHNVFAVVDEGEMLTKIGERSGVTIGATIRSAWGGETIGQANARDDTTRIVPADSYSLGLLIGFQPATALPLVSDTAAGTAQRFAWASAIDPTIPDEHVDHPGPLDVSLVGPTFHNTLRDSVIDFPSAVGAELRRQHLAKVRGEIDVDEADSQAPLMRAKMAALLSLLDGHATVADTHWQLAGVLLATSCAVRDALVQRAQAEQAKEIERRRQDAIERQVQAAAEVGQIPEKVRRLAGLLAQKVTETGGMTTGAARKTFASRDRHLYRAVVDCAVASELLVEGAAGLVPIGLRVAG